MIGNMDEMDEMDEMDDKILELIDDLWAGYTFECSCGGEAKKGFTCGDCLLKERVEELIRV